MGKFQRRSDEDLEVLRGIGCVHVTGLTTIRQFVSTAEKSVIHPQPQEDGVGKWWTNNSVVAIVFPDGQVWIGVRPRGENHSHAFARAINRLNLRDSSVFVPCSNGERVDSNRLLTRLADPYEDTTNTTVERLFCEHQMA